MSYIEQIKINPAQAVMDAGGILRVGSQTTLFDGKILNADDTDFWETVGTGTATFSANKHNLAVTSGQYLIKQTKHRFLYFSGKSQRYETTYDKFAPQTGYTKRVGYFSSNAVAPYNSNLDGMWVESSGGTISLNVYRNGTATLNALPITSWSGYANLAEYQTLATWDYFTVNEAKFLWLGGAVFVFSVKTSQGFIEAHRFDYSGTAQDVFTQSPNQPLRYEIRADVGAASTGELRYICSQVASEGSIDEQGKGLSLFNPTAITANVVGTIYVLLAIKKQTTYRDIASQVTAISVANTTVTTDSGILLLFINPTLSGALTYANISRIQVAYSTGQTITAGTGRVIAATQASAAGGEIQGLDKNSLAWLCSTISDAHCEYVLAYMPITSNQTVYGIINMKEY